MARLNVLVTGVGAIIGYGIIQSLRRTGRDVFVIGTDIYEDAVGRFFCDRFVRAERADAIGYADFLVELIRNASIDLVFFGTEQEVLAASDARSRLAEVLDRLVLNTHQVIELSRDKFRTHEFLRCNGFATIPTRIDGGFDTLAAELGTPFLLKLRRSYASKGMVLIQDRTDLEYWRARAGENFMAQKIVGDAQHEYTVAIFGRGGESSLPPFVLRRTLSGEGATAKAVVETLPGLANEAVRLADQIRPVGPTNLQYRLHEGRFLLLEINPRISSSTSIRAAFGYNEIELCIQHYVEHRELTPPRVRSGSACRYITEVVSYEDGPDR